MEGLGKKLQEARLARGLTLDEAGRMTKIRPAQLREIENEDFSQFPSLTYAKGFLDRKSTRLNSSHSQISYAVFCLKKKTLYAHVPLRPTDLVEDRLSNG